MSIKVSIIVITYNHERFLKDALDSALRQNVDFRYEIIVADDCSKDNNQKIIKDYFNKYPDIIVPILREENIGMAKNVLDAINNSKGKYISFLEGDDYWTSDNKLQRQIDFLDNNKEYVAISHDCNVIDQFNNVTDNKAWRFVIKEDEYTINNLEKFQLIGQMSTVVIKNFKEKINSYINLLNRNKICPLDSVLPLLLLSEGRIHVIKENLSSYRHFIEKDGTNWSSKNDLNVSNNYIIYYLMMRKIERNGKFFNLKINMIKGKASFFYDAWKKYKDYHSKKCLLMCILMFIFETHRIKMVKIAKVRGWE